MLEQIRINKIIEGYYIEEFDIEDTSKPLHFSDSHIVYGVKTPHGYAELYFDVKREALKAEESGSHEEILKYDTFEQRYDLDEITNVVL